MYLLLFLLINKKRAICFQMVPFKYRILNVEYSISKCFNFNIQNSAFDIHYLASALRLFTSKHFLQQIGYAGNRIFTDLLLF